MAKKKEKAGAQSLISHALAIVNRQDTAGESGGVEFRTFAERWLWDSNVCRVSEICQLAGTPASGKSQRMYNMAAMFVRAGGAAEIIDTEHKSNAEASIVPNVGEDVFYNSGRFGFSTAGSIDAAKAAKKGDESAQLEIRSAWMQMIKKRIDAIKAHEELRSMPIFLGVDSLLGAASAESRAKYEESGGSSDGRSMSGAVRAGSFTEWFPNITTDLEGTKICLCFTNHVKVKIDPNRPSYLPPAKSFPGGEAPKFHSSTILLFSRGQAVKKTNVGGRSVQIAVEKNSFGDDQRRLDVTFYYDIARDSKGEVLRDENGNPCRVLKWDWDEATSTLLKRFCLAGGTGKESSAAARAALPGLKIVKNMVECKQLDVPPMSMTEFGRLIMKREDIYQRIMEIPRLTIHHAPPALTYKPDWSDLENDSVLPEGGWDDDPTAEHLEVDA